MNSSDSIQIHQALHGYSDGHREFALSAKLTSRDAKLLLTLSDRSGPGISIPIGGYLTGYPLIESNLYVLARTWSAPEMPRPGCVWTHSLLIDFADLAIIEDTYGLLELFERPDAGATTKYHKKIQYFPNQIALPTIFDSEAGRVITALYEHAQRRIVATIAEADADSLALGIWGQQWPRLRRNFRFCTLSAADRSTESVPFDLQFLPSGTFSRSRFSKAFDAERSSVSSKTWLDEALDDLRFPGRNGLRTFLRLVGGDVSNGRESFAVLCRLHAMIQAFDEMDGSINEAINVFDNAFELGQARFARMAIVQAAATQAEYLNSDGLDFLLRNLEMLGPEPQTSILGNVGSVVWRREPNRLIALSEDIGTGHLVVKAAIGEVQLDELIAGLGLAPSLLGEVLIQRPEVLGVVDFWSINGADIHEALTIAASDVTLSAAAANALVNVERPDLSIVTTNMLGALCVGRALLEADCPSKIPLQWYSAVAAHPQSVAALFRNRQASKRQSVVQFSRVMSVDSLPSFASEDPWNMAIASSSGDVADQDRAYFAAFLLARALGVRSHATVALVVQSFEIVHEALAREEMPIDGWNILQSQLSQRWANWDRCLRVREAVGDLFADVFFPFIAFHQLTSNNDLFERIAVGMSWNFKGRAYLKSVRREMQSSGEKKFLPRIEILNKVLSLLALF